MKKVIVSVTNDLVTDRRVDKTCRTLVKLGFEVRLVGRRKRDSMKPDSRDYSISRMFLLFEKGPLFYAGYNTRLFFFLLFRKVNLLVANDLDTLLPNYIISRIKRIPLIYDTHEYYTGTPELIGRPFVQKFWKRIENWIFPKLKDVITVNGSIARLYENEYNIKLNVVRNIPSSHISDLKPTKKDLGLHEDKKIILLQGSGINIQRGAEEAVDAMKYIEDAVLIIIGDGDVIGILKQMVKTQGLAHKVFFIPKQPFKRLIHYTKCADIGITLDKDTNINYRFSLPNKLFDYIHAGIPVLASPLVEIKKIIIDYNIGTLIENHDPEHIASKMRYMLENHEQRKIWQTNLQKAARELCWEEEEKILIGIYQKYV